MWWAADFKPIAGQFSKSLRRKLQKEALEETGEQNSKRNFKVKVNSDFKERWQVSTTDQISISQFFTICTGIGIDTIQGSRNP